MRKVVLRIDKSWKEIARRVMCGTFKMSVKGWQRARSIQSKFTISKFIPAVNLFFADVKINWLLPRREKEWPLLWADYTLCMLSSTTTILTTSLLPFLWPISVYNRTFKDPWQLNTYICRNCVAGMHAFKQWSKYGGIIIREWKIRSCSLLRLLRIRTAVVF